MDKPSVGDVLKVKDPEASFGDPDHKFVRVLTVYDRDDFIENGGQGWGDDGEHAWSQMDHNEAMGQTGEWYAIVSHCDKDGNVLYEGETASVGSYEVEV